MQGLPAKLKGDTGRLAGTYLAIIMGLTLIFTSVVYSISSSQFDRPLPPGGQARQLDDFTRDDIQQLFQERADQARSELLLSFVFLNLAVFIGGAFFSYFLARRSLQPIEAAMEAQIRFVSDASHELRTPLAALLVTNEVALRKKKLTLLDAKELIGYNLAETIKLRDLSEALLGLAKQSDADTTKAPTDLTELVSGVIRTLQPLADDKDVTLRNDVAPLSVDVNQSAVSQILRIFIDNAIKYSDRDSTIHVLRNGTTISVEDSGAGIAPEHQTKIFDRFYRVDESRSSQHASGSGLGLSIAKAIADRQGFSIALNSEPGHGSTFSVRI